MVVFVLRGWIDDEDETRPSTGTLDCLLVHAREVFRAAVVAAARSIIPIHSHPSGDPSPSEADIRNTGDLMRSGSILKLPVLDNIVIAPPPYLPPGTWPREPLKQPKARHPKCRAFFGEPRAATLSYFSAPVLAPLQLSRSHPPPA